MSSELLKSENEHLQAKIASLQKIISSAGFAIMVLVIILCISIFTAFSFKKELDRQKDVHIKIVQEKEGEIVDLDKEITNLQNQIKEKDSTIETGDALQNFLGNTNISYAEKISESEKTIVQLQAKVKKLTEENMTIKRRLSKCCPNNHPAHKEALQAD